MFRANSWRGAERVRPSEARYPVRDGLERHVGAQDNCLSLADGAATLPHVLPWPTANLQCRALRARLMASAIGRNSEGAEWLLRRYG